VPSDPLEILPSKGTRRIPPPAAFLQREQSPAATPDDFQITFNGTWTDEEKNAFNYAAGIWSALIDAKVKINITANKSDSCYCGGQAVVWFDYPLPPNMPVPNTNYPRALSNHLAGKDLMPGTLDFEVYYAANTYPWYYGTDGNVPGNKVDFVTVILHEIAHGIGMVSSFHTNNYGGIGHFPYIHDRFIENGNGEVLVNKYPPGDWSDDLGAEILTDQIYFDGAHLRSLNQNTPARLQAGSPDLDHLHEDTYDNTPDSLMTSTLNYGEAIHDPGGIILGILADEGWKLSPDVPVFYPLPSQMLLVNTQRLNAIDLWQHIPAYQSPDTDFSYTISNTPDANAGVSLHDNRYIDVVPAPGWLGSTQVTVKATNLLNLSAYQTFNVLVVNQIYSSFLPKIGR
jgi:hypothetical protein